MSEYLEKQHAEEARHRRAFEEEQRKVWTPPSLLEKCCMQWLAHGPTRTVRSGSNLASVAYRGCCGCLKEHPKIALDFMEGVATASISHAFDPFVQLFTQLPEAVKVQPLTYQLKNGLLSDHYETIKQKVGAHLVSIEPKALAASRRYYEKQLEQNEMQREAKRRKVLGGAAPTDVLLTVLEICYNHSLCDHLDVADIAWMRTTCKSSMGKIAARMARDRMRGIKLSYTSYSPSWDTDFDGFEMNDPPHRRLLRDTTTASLAALCPRDPQQPISWDYSGDNPSHVRIEVHLDKKENSDIPERRVFFSKYTKHLEVARYLIDSRQFHEEGVYKSFSQVQNRDEEGSLEYRVTLCVLDENFFGRTSSHGKINLESVKFTFGDLLGVYVRMKIYKAKQKYNRSPIKNPVDKSYIKALAKATREAPGNVNSFSGMEGWDHIP